MSKKKSGLADNPLFDNPSKAKPVSIPPKNESKSTYTKLAELSEQEAKNEQKRSDGHPTKRSSGQTVGRSNGHDYRVIKRRGVDLYLDQYHTVDEEVMRRSRQTGQSVTKGEVMREIVDFYFSKKKK